VRFEDQVRANCGKLPSDRVTVSRFNIAELSAMSCGVVFVFATWSGHAVRSFRFLCEALAASPGSKFPVLVIDADGLDVEAFNEALGELPQGKGEAYWIQNGQVVHRDRGYTEGSRETLLGRITKLT
jgi:hypothetical protein